MEIETTETKSTKKSKRNDKKRSEFEYCKVCKLNHDQAHRHKYFPSHKKSLSIVFSKFQTKLSDIRFFLRNPSLLRPEHASRNRHWCVFCDLEVDELGSSFACDNVINHLASVEHLKNLKHFLWKYGGESSSVDKFRIKEAEFAKWEKKCKSLKNEAAVAKKSSCEPSVGPANHIHNELDYVSSSGLVKVANGGSENTGSSSINLNNSTEVAIGNVHTGAPPPWLQVDEINQLNSEQTVSASFVSKSNNPGKSKKLNPERVGAAWAERRKKEMELEKRGELVKREFDADWLPNFGRVWQSGTRKESRKEFESGNQSLPKVETPPPEPVKIQPYVSKRMKEMQANECAPAQICHSPD